MKHSRIRVYDKPETLDRYTLVIPSLDEPHSNEYFGFSEDPFFPTGFGQFAGTYPMEHSYKHLGKLIPIESLPEQARKYVEQVIKVYEETKKEEPEICNGCPEHGRDKCHNCIHWNGTQTP